MLKIYLLINYPFYALGKRELDIYGRLKSYPQGMDDLLNHRKNPN